MIRRRFSSSLSSLIVGLLSNHRTSCHRHHHHHHHHRRGCYCLMAVSSSSTSYSLLSQGNNCKNDPLLFSSSNSNKGFHVLSYTALNLKQPATKTIISNSAAGNDNNSNSNSSGCSNGNNNRKFTYKARRPRAFAPHLPQLLGRDSDKANGLVEETNNCRDLNWLNNSGAYHTIGLPDEPLPEKLVVAVDVDEVLGNFVSALNRFIADRYSLNHSVSEYHVYEFFKIWNCSRVEADVRVHEFFKTSYFKTGIHPIPGALQALKKLSKFCNLSVVTSRQNAIKDHTIEWIEQHFPGLFQEIQFGNHFALDGQSRRKSDICRSLGAKVLIDDNPRYAAECAEAGIKVLLFDYENSYPWCKTESVAQHPLVVKVHSWEEVEHQLVSQNLSRKLS